MKVRDFEVGECIGQSPRFRIYLGNNADGAPVVLKVAKTFEDGELLAREASEFSILQSFKEDVAKIEAQTGRSNHYDWLFADLLASFMEPSQGDRRINVLSAVGVDLSKLTPLTKLHSTIEIDARTSVWILGRFFKFYGMFELIAASKDEAAPNYPIFSSDDYLVGPEMHRLVYYNFSGDAADVVAFDFVKAIANFMLSWVVINNESEERKYCNLLADFAKNGRETFEKAHSELYALVQDIWGIQYYPFTYRDQGTIVWKNLN